MGECSPKSRTRLKFRLLSKQSSTEYFQDEDSLLASPNKFLSKKNHEKPKGNENHGFEITEAIDDPSGPRPAKPERKKSKKTRLALDTESTFISSTCVDCQETPAKETCVIDVESVADTCKDLPEEATSKAKRKNKKKGKKTESSVLDEAVNENQPKREVEQNFQDDPEIFGVVIHRTDRLTFDFFISHPMIKVYLVDEPSGTFLRKSQKDRSVVSYYENQTENPISFISPIMTQPFAPQGKSVLLPIWEEVLIFNESFNYITKPDHSVLIFFELLDFISPSHPLFEIKRVANTGGWYCVSWAFLKLRGITGHLNISQKVRLQLYKPSFMGAKSDIKEIYGCWKRRKRIKYPATLYVTVKSMTKPNDILPSHRSMIALQPEVLSNSSNNEIDELNSENIQSSFNQSENKLPKVEASTCVNWTRFPGQTCKVPKKNCHFVKSSNNDGCFRLKFSKSGRFLASTYQYKDRHFISIYNVLTGIIEQTLTGHGGLIYSLDWNDEDALLLSASSDATVRIWDFPGGSNVTILPHPSYVYTAKFEPLPSSNEYILVATGCYDGMLRIWSVSTEDFSSFNLLRELDGHGGSLNYILWHSERMLVSGDSVGVIKIWMTKKRKKNYKDFVEQQTLNVNELKGISINNFHLSPTGNKLMVHTRGQQFFVLDLKLGLVAKSFEKPLATSLFSQSCLTTCGTLIFVPDGENIYVWSAITGDLVYKYENMPFKKPISCIEYHPHDHIMSVSGFGENSPILIYQYDLEEIQVKSSSSDIRSQINSPTISPIHLKNRDELTKKSVSCFDENPNRLETVIRKLDSVMNVVSQFKSTSVSNVSRSSAEDIFRRENSAENCLSDVEIPNEKFTAVVNKMGELEIISPSKPRKRRKGKERIS